MEFEVNNGSMIRLGSQLTDWRPRRTIVFCSWSAEEYGLIGSFEWVQQHNQLLSQRAVAYLNVDEAVKGIHFVHNLELL